MGASLENGKSDQDGSDFITKMRSYRIRFPLVLVFALLGPKIAAAQFVVFPRSGQLVSPDRRFAVRSEDRSGPAADFVGTFHSLWLTESATGRSRKLCDYMGAAAVAWSGNDYVIVTQYVGRRTSRALLFDRNHPDDALIFDKSAMLGFGAAELRASLQENDHVFIEASRIEGKTLHLRVWGYGQHDPNGFRWHCEYALAEGTARCTADSSSR